MTSDVLIIGGGVMGLFTAVHLRQLGVSHVTLIEKRFCGAGSSGKSGAICRQHYSNEVTAGLARDSLARFASFAGDFANDGGFRRTGCLFFASPENAQALRNNVELQQSWGIDTHMVGLGASGGVGSIEPRFDVSDGPAACYEPGAGWCDPALVLHALEHAARGMGVEVRIGERARAIETDGGRCQGVTLEGGERIEAGTVVNCAGPWAAPLARTAGVNLPINATRPQIAFTRRPFDAGGFDRDHPIVCDLVNSYYCRPDAAGLTLIGGLDMEADPPVPDPDDEAEGIADGIVATLNARLANRFPAMQRARSRGGMSALYACTPDYHPIIGPHAGCERLYTCAGFSGHGFKLSPEVGRELAHHIVKGSWADHDMDIFRATRFEDGDPVRGRYEYSILG